MQNQKRKSIFNRLSSLFSTGGVVVRHVGGKKFNVVDTNTLQGLGNKNLRRDRFQKLFTQHSEAGNGYGLTNGSGYGPAGTGTSAQYGNRGYQQQNIEFQRNKIYVDYELMDKDPIISSAFDILADESTVQNEYGEILVIKSDNQDIKEILENLFIDILNIEFNLNSWVRNLVKYGDFYLALDLVENNGIVNAYPLSPYFMYRVEGNSSENQYDVKFHYDLGDGKKEEYDQYEVAHFRMLGDTSFLPYGRSMGENGRFIFKQLYLMEEAMMIHRIMRAPEKRVFKIDVGNLTDVEVESYMNKVVNRSKKTPLIDDNTGQYNLKYNMQNILEDFYIPIRGAHSSAEIESLSGLEYNAIDDIEYLRDKLFSALKVPKAYLSYDSEIDGKATLAAEDVKFAKTIQRIQKVVISEFTKIAIVHLYLQGYRDADITNFKLELVNPSIIFEKEMIDLLNQKSDLMSSLTENKLMSRKRAYEVIFNYTPDEIANEEKSIIDDHKLKFRLTQIEDEGNDPMVSGESYGTPHDIASMHTANREPGSEEGGQPGAGKPPQYGSNHRTDKGSYGRDPLGGNDVMKQMGIDKDLKHNFRSGSPLNAGVIPKKKILFNNNPRGIENSDMSGTFLDESNIRE